MTHQGTARYDHLTEADGVPQMVLRAVEVARSMDFPLSVHPATGRLLAALASGVVDGVIGETGTGTGVGLAWMLSTAPPTTRLVSIELDAERAAAAKLLADHPNVTVLHGEANELAAHAPFDLLVLDSRCDPGPLHRAGLEPRAMLRPGGVVVKDDLWPMTDWPPRTFGGEVDDLRIRFFDHPDLFTTEVTVADGFAVQLGRLRPPR